MKSPNLVTSKASTYKENLNIKIKPGTQLEVNLDDKTQIKDHYPSPYKDKATTPNIKQDPSAKVELKPNMASSQNNFNKQAKLEDK